MNSSASPLNEEFSTSNNDTRITTTPNATGPLDGLFSNATTNNATAVFPSDATTISDMDPVTNGLLSLGLFIVFFYCCIRNQVPAEERRRGRELRERARRNWKGRLSPQERRKQLVDANLRTKRVIAQDGANGHMTLGSIVSSEDTASPQKSNSFPPTNEDEEHVCVICLEPFQVHDIVSWSRTAESCHHVFHSECIQPWLVQKRHDDCPSCRSVLIPDIRTMVKDEEMGDMDTNSRSDGVDTVTVGENEEEEEEDDSLFVIMHGLISRAARRASYSLVGTASDSFDDEEIDNHHSSVDLSVPSPMRRVVSHGSRRSFGSFRSFRLPTVEDDDDDDDTHTTQNDKSSPLATPIPFRRSHSEGPSVSVSRRSSLPPTIRRRLSKSSSIFRGNNSQAAFDDPSESSVDEGDLEWLVPPASPTILSSEGSQSSFSRRLDDIGAVKLGHSPGRSEVLEVAK